MQACQRMQRKGKEEEGRGGEGRGGEGTRAHLQCAAVVDVEKLEQVLCYFRALCLHQTEELGLVELAPRTRHVMKLLHERVEILDAAVGIEHAVRN